MADSSLPYDEEFWVIKGYKILDNGHCSYEKNVAGPFKTKDKAQNAMSELTSKGETDLICGSFRFPKLDFL